ncbi:hypothetical protein FS837_004397, partial [Tulasnella sp. UAMH 9824]
MTGLNSSGRTTILYKLKLGEIVTTIPETKLNVETVLHGKIFFTIWDVGAIDDIQSMWKFFMKRTKGIIFVVDTNDWAGISEAREELQRLMNEDKLRDAAFLIYANKQDLPNAMNATQIIDGLGLRESKQRNWYIQAACATSGDGLYEGLDW